MTSSSQGRGVNRNATMSSTLKYTYPNQFETSPDYGREIYVKNLPANASEAWLLELFSRFGRPVQIRYYRPDKEAHVKYSSFEEACNAVESTSQHSLRTSNGKTFNLNVVHSRDFPFVVFSNFKSDFYYDKSKEVFARFFGKHHVVGVTVRDRETTNPEVILQFDNYEFARNVVNSIKKIPTKTLRIEKQNLHVKWHRIPTLTVSKLTQMDSNEDVKNLFSQQIQIKIKRIVRKPNVAYVWFQDVEATIQAKNSIGNNGNTTTTNGTNIIITYMGKE